MTTVLIELATAQRFARATEAVERSPLLAGQGGDRNARLLQTRYGEVLYGTLNADFTSGATVELTPCDCEGTATGESAVTVNILPDGSSVSVEDADVAGVSTSVSCKVASGKRLPYAVSVDGTKVLVGHAPQQSLVDWRFYLDSGVPKAQVKVAFDLGAAWTTVSAWTDLATGKCIADVDLGAP